MRKNEERDASIYEQFFIKGVSKAQIARNENISATRVRQIIMREAIRVGDAILSRINKRMES